jgi:hypothetical protein
MGHGNVGQVAATFKSLSLQNRIYQPSKDHDWTRERAEEYVIDIGRYVFHPPSATKFVRRLQSTLALGFQATGGGLGSGIVAKTMVAIA